MENSLMVPPYNHKRNDRISFQCVLFLPDFSPEMNPLNSYGQCFADNELHNIKGYTEDQKKIKILAMATVTINTTTQNQIICKFHGISFYKTLQTTKFLLFQKVYQVKLADLHYLCLLFQTLNYHDERNSFN